MKTVVLKFGGTSVGSIDRIKKVCKIITSYKKKKYRVIVVSSAMSGITNDLINKSKLISNNFDKAEYDTLVSTGEQVSCAQETCSPVDTKVSYSALSKLLLISLDLFIRSFVIPLMAEETTITLYFFFL